jgi:hypothetical protein
VRFVVKMRIAAVLQVVIANSENIFYIINMKIKKTYFKPKRIKIIIYVILLCLIGFFSSCGEDTCWVCGGSGKCYDCNGKGYIKVDANVCDVCKGTGKCFNCQGTGKININMTIISHNINITK